MSYQKPEGQRVLKENPSLFDVARYFTESIQAMHSPTNQKKTLATCLRGIFQAQKRSDVKICDEFEIFVERHFNEQNQAGLQKLVDLAQSKSTARVQQELAKLYTELEQRYLEDKREKEFRGKTIFEVDQEIRGQIAKATGAKFDLPSKREAK